jgi:hypothetical protein
MNWSSVTTVAGVGVAAVGLAAVLATTAPDAAPTSVTPPANTVSAAPDTTRGPETDAVPEIPGVADVVTRVLYWNGAVERVAPQELSGVPEEVGSVLMEYGVPLRVPASSDGAGE